MKTAAFVIALLMSSAATAQTEEPETTPGSATTTAPSAEPGTATEPTISDSAPGSTAPMPPSRLNVVPPVSADKNVAEQVGTASDTPGKSFEATPATTADLAKGVTINDPSGAQVGTIASMTESGAVVEVGKRLIQIPLTSIGKNDKGLVIAMTKAEMEAAATAPPKK